MKTRYRLIITAVLVAACGCWAGFVIWQRNSQARRKTDYFARLAEVNDRLREGLDRYYDLHGRYPPALKSLSMYQAEPQRAAIADKFSYLTDGTYYILTWAVQWGDEPPLQHKEHAIKGKVVFVEDYVDDRLARRVEYPEGRERPGSRTEKLYRDGQCVSVTEYKNGTRVRY